MSTGSGGYSQYFRQARNAQKRSHVDEHGSDIKNPPTRNIPSAGDAPDPHDPTLINGVY